MKNLSPSSPKEIAIITSLFNKEITQLLYEGARQYLLENNIFEEKIISVWVPGAIEIPLIAQKLAKTNRFSVIICLGAVIRGDTSHFDYVCDQVSYGCQRVALDHDIPIIFGVLTTDNEEQALERCGGRHGHKGKEAAQGALEMILLCNQIRNMTIMNVVDS